MITITFIIFFIISSVLQGIGMFGIYIGMIFSLSISGFLTSWLAKQKGYDPLKWFFFGMFGGYTVLLAVGIFLEDKKSNIVDKKI
jgi:hypothetical protein